MLFNLSTIVIQLYACVHIYRHILVGYHGMWGFLTLQDSTVITMEVISKVQLNVPELIKVLTEHYLDSFPLFLSVAATFKGYLILAAENTRPVLEA